MKKQILKELSKQSKNKKQTSYHVNYLILEQFNNICKENDVNKSLLVERLMKDFLESK